MGNEPLDRLLNLTSLLLETSRPLTFEEIRERLPDHYRQSNPETARRQFERDKEALIEIGIEVEMVRGLTDAGVEGYRATRARELQNLDLSPDELAALHLAATSVVLDGVDEDEIVTGIQKLGGVVGGEGAPVAKIEMPEAVGPLFGAVLRRQVATFDYGGVTRDLEPHRIGFERGNWYVSGLDRTREANRNFRIDRIDGKVSLGPVDGFPVPEQREEIRSEAWTLGTGSAVDVTVRLDREVAPAFLHDFPSASVVSSDPDGSRLVVLEVNHQMGLFNTVLPLLERAEIVDPPDVRSAFVAHLQSMAEGV